MKKDTIIYHYCSLEALHSIITSKSFWLFSLDSSNDLDETTKAKEIIDKVLEKEKEKYKSIYKPDNSKQEEFYSLSCTYKKDSALHFNKYADNDKGVCFGVDAKVFEKYLKNTLLTKLGLCYFFFPKVIYENNQKEREIKKYLDERLRYIDQVEKTAPKEIYELLIKDVSPEQNKDFLRKLAYITALSRFKPKLKITNYKDEAETRMLFCRNLFQVCQNLFKDKSSNFYNSLIRPAEYLNLGNQPEFKVMSGVIRKCIELKMNKIWDKQPIKEVILGPNCKTEIKEFNEFLEAKGISCKAKESKIKNRK